MPKKRYLKEILIKIYFRILRTFFALNNVENFEQTIFFSVIKRSSFGTYIYLYLLSLSEKSNFKKEIKAKF
jgi:hypothetical protein